MRSLDLAYLAGVMDSDGCISIGVDMSDVSKGKSPRFFELIAVHQVQPEAVQLCYELFGGNMSVKKPACGSGRSLFAWSARNQIAVSVARALLPYLRLKRTQAEIVLALRAIKDRGRIANTCFEEGPTIIRQGRWGKPQTFRRRYLSPHVIEECRQLVCRVRALNDTRLSDPFDTRLSDSTVV